MKYKMHVAQVFVSNEKLRSAFGLPADTNLLAVDGLNVPLGFFTILVETKRLPLAVVTPGSGARTVALSDLQKKAAR